MKVHLGSVLHEYTGGRAEVQAQGTTVAGVLEDLDRRYPGLRFRVVDEQGAVRPHMRVFLGDSVVSDLRKKVSAADELHVLGALSGG